MSDVEKAISGLVEDEVLLKQHQHQQQQQQQNLQPIEQQSATRFLNKINSDNYNLQNETGNSSLLQKESGNNDTRQHHPHQQQGNNRKANTNTNYLISKQHNNCLSRVAKLIFSTPGLVVMVVVYTIMGAFLFPLLEAPQDISKSALIAKSREECLKELWIITEKLNVLYERNWTMLVHEQLRRFEGTIVAATRNMAVGTTQSSGGSSEGGGGRGQNFGMAIEATATTTTAAALGRYGGNNLMEYSDLTTTRWSFSEALLYSVTVITTIGHGSLTPRTAGGKIATIFYALIGVPLMLMCLSSLGALLAEALQCTYARLCCRWPQFIVHDADDLDNTIAHTKHLQAQRIKRQRDCTSRAEMKVQKETSHQIKQNLQHQCNFQDHKNNRNCKNCKYDDIIGEINTNHGYDYKLCNDAAITSSTSSTSPSLSSTAAAATTAAPITTTTALTTIKLGHKEDCCQLLHNSSGKFTQHLSSCMQLKASPTVTVSGSKKDVATAQKQQPQQQNQYYQQRPDVMLMATSHKLSSQQPTTMATGCHMVLPPPLLASSQTQRFYANATPAMAKYHLVSSASANSSPTHQQSIRHYIVPQMPQMPLPTASTSASISSLLPAPSLTSVMGTQHFMAVPSSVLHFHHQTTTPQTAMQQQQQQQQCSGNITSNININPLALPVSATATVYIPIVTPAAPAAGNGCQNSIQPSFKYHTLQPSHKRQHGLTLLQPNDLVCNQHINAADDDVYGSLFPPPPPPAYQTATVHGMGRAKLLTKPLAQIVDSLQQECDISCRHDLSQNLTTFNNNNNSNDLNLIDEDERLQQQLVAATVYTPTTHAVMLANENAIKTKISMPTTITTAVNTYAGSSNTMTTTTLSSPTINTTKIYENYDSTINHSLQQQQQQQQTHIVNNQLGLILVSEVKNSEGSGQVAATTAAAVAMVDIMEDEDEQEQQRLGDFPHGTPSRVPLLTSSSNAIEDKTHTRNFLNATAASLHRHTLNTFQRSSSSMANQRKSLIINHKGECNVHEPKRGNYSRATIYYADKYDDMSDEDCDELEGDNVYKLRPLQHSLTTHCQTNKQHLAQADFGDNHSLVSLSDSTSQIPQVPIILVLFILTFYVCLGTVIFALWENWSLIDGAYFCFVTLTTIGYGDFVPWQTFQGPDIQLFACCAYLLLGLVLVAMAFSILETQLIWKCKRLAVRLKLAKE